MEPVNKEEARKQRLAEWRERNKDAIKAFTDTCKIINCACGGKHMLKGRTEHFKTKMHINFLKQQEQLDRLQEVEDIKEQELRDNNAEVETWKVEEKAPEIKPDKTTRRPYFGRFRSDYDESGQTKLKHVVYVQVKKGF